MVSRWKLDEGSGTEAKDSWGTNHGTLNNFNFNSTSGWANESECVSGKCLRFDGSNDYVSIQNSSDLDITENITISAWIKPDIYGQSDYHIVLKGEADYSWFFGTASNKVAMLVGKAAGRWNVVLTGGTLVDGWNHIIGMYESGKGLAAIYLNGIFVKDLAGTIEECKSPNGFRMGLQSSDNYTFDGLIDDVRIYNAALSSSQIKQNYIAGLDSLLSKGLISKQEYITRIEELSNKNFNIVTSFSKFYILVNIQYI